MPGRPYWCAPWSTQADHLVAVPGPRAGPTDAWAVRLVSRAARPGPGGRVCVCVAWSPVYVIPDHIHRPRCLVRAAWSVVRGPWSVVRGPRAWRRWPWAARPGAWCDPPRHPGPEKRAPVAGCAGFSPISHAMFHVKHFSTPKEKRAPFVNKVNSCQNICNFKTKRTP